jgi:hypothetical protein
MVRTIIHTIDRTIPRLGTATVPMGIRTIGSQSVESTPSQRALIVLDSVSPFNCKRRKHRRLAGEQHKRHGHRIKTIRPKLAMEKIRYTVNNMTTAILCTVGDASPILATIFRVLIIVIVIARLVESLSR